MPRIVHGLRNSREYKVWSGMVARCHNPNDPSFARYGGRGIVVSELWRRDFAKFFADVGPRPTEGMTLDRIDNERGYEPGNVRWATAKEQQRNRRNNRLYEFDGQLMTVTAIAELTGVNFNTIKYRLHHGWPESLAFTTPSGAFAPSHRWGVTSWTSLAQGNG